MGHSRSLKMALRKRG